jgi:hypothetical protein
VGLVLSCCGDPLTHDNLVACAGESSEAGHIPRCGSRDVIEGRPARLAAGVIRTGRAVQS